MKFLCSLILSLLCIAAIGRSTTHAQKLEKLVIGYPAPVASLGIIDVMRKAGLFKKNGLDVDLVYIQGSPVLTTAMVSGQVPMSISRRRGACRLGHRRRRHRLSRLRHQHTLLALFHDAEHKNHRRPQGQNIGRHDDRLAGR